MSDFDLVLAGRVTLAVREVLRGFVAVQDDGGARVIRPGAVDAQVHADILVMESVPRVNDACISRFSVARWSPDDVDSRRNMAARRARLRGETGRGREDRLVRSAHAAVRPEKGTA